MKPLPKYQREWVFQSCFAFDDSDRFFNDCIIAGNIEPAVIHMGRPDEIYRLCMAALAQGSQAPRGYILMPGCGIPPNVPTQNLLMLKKAASDFMDEHKILG